ARRTKLDEDRERRLAEARERGAVAQVGGDAPVAPPIPVTAEDDPEAPAVPHVPPAPPVEPQ
ncbi:MAG: hypothetical protein H0V89_09525, partial [Deltaproteobacteria bacterium]|nr:hypothetical protein [Deltaproteobacteria bacterium]